MIRAMPTTMVDSPTNGAVEQRIARIREQVLSRGDLIQLIEQDDLYTRERRTQPLSKIIEKMRHSTSVGALSSDIGQQSGAGVSDHSPPVRAHRDLRTCSGSLHLASAFRDGRSGPSTSQIIPDQKALPHS